METKTYEQIVDGLKASGFRITNQRLAIVRYLVGRSDHPGVKQISNAMSKKGLDISLATIYNTLEVLVNNNLIRELNFDGKENRYDTNISPHINLICTKCGSITDYPYELRISPGLLKRKKGFTATDFRLEYRGICNKCQ